MCHCACSVALTPCLWSSGVSESSVGHPPPTFMVSIQPRKMGVWVQETETPAWGWERRPEVRPEGWSSCSQLLRTGGVFSRKREPDARAVLTLGRRRTRVPLKRRRPADRGETRVRLSGPASSLPWSRAPVRVCLGAAGGWGGVGWEVAWRLRLEQTNKGVPPSLRCKLGTLAPPISRASNLPQKAWGKEVRVGREAGSDSQGNRGRGPSPARRPAGRRARPSPARAGAQLSEGGS